MKVLSPTSFPKWSSSQCYVMSQTWSSLNQVYWVCFTSDIQQNDISVQGDPGDLLLYMSKIKNCDELKTSNKFCFNFCARLKPFFLQICETQTSKISSCISFCKDLTGIDTLHCPFSLSDTNRQEQPLNMEILTPQAQSSEVTCCPLY